jgi:hypothetical protein
MQIPVHDNDPKWDIENTKNPIQGLVELKEKTLDLLSHNLYFAKAQGKCGKIGVTKG